MEDTLLSAGALSVMMNGQPVDEAVVVQVLGSLKLHGIVEKHERYRLLISDGEHVISHVMLAVKLNDMGTTTAPERFSVIHVKKYFTTLVPRPGVVRILLVLADIQVVFPADEIQGPIGNPSALFDEDVVIVPRDSALMCLPEPVFGSVSTVHMHRAGLSASVEQLSTAAIKEALPAVQTLPKAKLQPVRTLSPASLPSSGTSSASSQLIAASASPMRAIDLSMRLLPADAHVELLIPAVKSTSMQVAATAAQVASAATPVSVEKLPAVQITPAVQPTPAPTAVQKPPPVQRSTPAVQLTYTPTPAKRPRLEQITPAFQPTPTPTPMHKPPNVQIPTPAVQPTPSPNPTPAKKPRLSRIPTPTFRLTPTPTAVKKPPPVQRSTPAVQLTHTPTPAAAAPAPVKKLPPAQLTPAPTPVQKPSPVQMTPVVQSAPGSTGTFSTSVPSVTPIAKLHPTTRNWMIKARVTAKSPIKPWARGSGCSFTADLADESGEIKATVFTEWVNKFFGIFMKDQVYYISRANLKSSNKRFNHLNHDYEMVLHGGTSVVPCDEQVRVAEAKYKFVPLNEVSDRQHGSVIDVIGVCTSAAEVESVMTRGGVMPKREVILLDQTFTSVSMKLWGEHAGTCDPTNCPIIAVRGAMVNKYCGDINLTTLVSSVVRINPNIPEAQRLRRWYAGSGNQ